MIFDRERLSNEISSLSRERRLALCAFFSERLISFYEEYAAKFDDRISVFRSCLDAIWAHINDQRIETVDLAALREEAESNIPDEVDLGIDSLYAQDAAIAVTCAVYVWANDNPKTALECLEQCYNVVDSIVLNSTVPEGIISEAAESEILQDSRLQDELQFQRKFIDACLEFDEIRWHSYLRVLQAQAVENRIKI